MACQNCYRIDALKFDDTAALLGPLLGSRIWLAGLSRGHHHLVPARRDGRGDPGEGVLPGVFGGGPGQPAELQHPPEADDRGRVSKPFSAETIPSA